MLDTVKLFKLLTNNPELTDVPIKYIVLVAKCVIETIDCGECMLDWRE